MRVSVLSVCVGVLALLSSATALPNDFQCHSGNSNDNGVCLNPTTSADETYMPAYNRQDNTFSFISFETDQARVSTVVTTDESKDSYDTALDVRRVVWNRDLDPNTQDGVGNSVRQQSSIINGDLPAGFLDFPFQMAYRADGFRLVPHPNGAETVTSLGAFFYYNTKNTAIQNQPNLVADGNSDIWYLYQPAGEFGLTAGKGTLQISSGTASSITTDANIWGTTLPNGGVGTYYQTRRLEYSGSGAQTRNVAVASGKTLQSVGGPNAPGNTYTVNAVTGVYDRPVLTNLKTPSVGGAFLTLTLTSLADASITPPAGKVFISQGVLTVQSLTPVDSAGTGVPFTGTYSLDTTGSTADASTFVAGTQKLYVRAAGETDWIQLSSAYDVNSKVVSYTLSSSDVPVAAAAALEMTVQADEPAPVVSSSTAPDVPSSSTAPGVASSSSAAPAPISSSSTASPPPAASSSSTASPPPAVSSSSSGAATPRVSSSSGATVQAVSSSSSSGAGAGAVSSSSGPANGEFPDNAASSVAASGVAVVLAAAAAVAALYA